MQTVNEIMSDELDALGLDADLLGDTSQAAVAAIVPVLDGIMPPIGHDPEALRVVAAALRSYARVAETYAAALDAHTETTEETL